MELDHPICQVCEERPAAWRAGRRGRATEVCDDCRRCEPCRRCGVETDTCRCAEGPDMHVWLPIADEG